MVQPRRTDFALATRRGPIQCRLDGREGAPWLVFSNSHGTNLTMWDVQAEALADDFNILRYDQRGHGGTPIDGPCDFDALADDLIAVMDAAGAATASLVGISMGAVTVLRVAARYPSRIERVIAADGQWRPPPGGHEAWQARVDIAEAQGVEALAVPTVERWFLPGLAHRDPALFDRVRTMIAATSLAGYVGCARALQAYDFSADFPAMRVPALFLAGANDGAMPATMRTMAAATPGSRFAVIPEAGHLPNLERPEAFLDVIAPFLRGEPAATSL